MRHTHVCWQHSLEWTAILLEQQGCEIAGKPARRCVSLVEYNNVPGIHGPTVIQAAPHSRRALALVYKEPLANIINQMRTHRIVTSEMPYFDGTGMYSKRSTSCLQLVKPLKD